MFKISARTILELGSELISSDIIAFYELIKNGFDARTKNGINIHFSVVLRRNSYLTLTSRAKGETDSLKDLKESSLKNLNSDCSQDLLLKATNLIESSSSYSELVSSLENIYRLSTITISDTGAGMSIDELENNFLVIGTSSRKKAVDKAIEEGKTATPYLGEKGIGRLSAMRLGEHLYVKTAKTEDSNYNILDINWNDFANLDAMLSDIKVTPTQGENKSTTEWSGTQIVIGALSENWTKDRLIDMAKHDFSRLTDPFQDPKKRPRIAIYWNGDRITIPWMDQELIRNAHAKVTGTYDVSSGTPVLKCTMEAINLGFDHPREIETVTIGTHDLEGLLIGESNELHDDSLLNVGPFSFEMHWFNRQKLKKIDGIGDLKEVRKLQRQWSGIMLFRESFRVFPYGDDEDDWLGLDRKALGRSGYALNKAQFVGRVNISRIGNPQLIDQTNREGLRETQEQKVFLEILSQIIQWQLLGFIKNVEKQYKNQKVDLTEAKNEVSTLEQRAKTALSSLRKQVPDSGKQAVEDLQQTIFEFSEFADRARKRIEEVEKESHRMIEMAGVGLMVEVVAHELARSSENAIENLNLLKGKDVPEHVQLKLESLRAQMKSLSKRVKILDPMSISGRQRKENFSLNQLISETLEAHEAQFSRHNISVSLDFDQSGVNVNAVKGMLVQILENLISNSKYWLEMRAERDRSFIPTISIYTHQDPPTIIFEDNGRGIAPENRLKVFRPFFSLKEKKKRRGLGLYVASECAEYNGGALTLDEQVDDSTGRLHRFILELPEKKIVR